MVVTARWSGSEAMSEGQQQAHQQHNPQPLRSVHEPFEPLVYGGNLLNLLVGVRTLLGLFTEVRGRGILGSSR
jgi:hypothetical protein